MKEFMKENKKGFTLIELLVVIAIIGLLASIVLVSLKSVRAKARDARRAADFHQIVTALEIYLDNNGDYPTGGFDTCSGSWSNGFNTLFSPYLSNVPVDPLNKTGGNCSTNPYYSFYNPVSWPFGGNCPAGTTILYGTGVETGTFQNDCGTTEVVRNIILRR